MPRQARRDAPGAVHHVMLRGIERRPIFLDDTDRTDFLVRLEKQVTDGGFACFAWALLPNHAHLMLRTGCRPLSSSMRRLNTGYARAFNLRWQRNGYLFQDRFGSILVDDEAYLRVLLGYVHLNPLRAGLVRSLDDLERYPWAGHARLMGAEPPGFQAVSEVLNWFSPNAETARRELCGWMAQGLRGPGDDTALALSTRKEPGCVQAPRLAVAASPGAAPDVRPVDIRANLRRTQGWTIEHLAAWVCATLGADRASVRRGDRTRLESQARAVIGLLAIQELGCTVFEISRFTGVTSGAISRAIRRGEAIARDLGIVLPEIPDREKSQ